MAPFLHPPRYRFVTENISEVTDQCLAMLKKCPSFQRNAVFVDSLVAVDKI